MDGEHTKEPHEEDQTSYQERNYYKALMHIITLKCDLYS